MMLVLDNVNYCYSLHQTRAENYIRIVYIELGNGCLSSTPTGYNCPNVPYCHTNHCLYAVWWNCLSPGGFSRIWKISRCLDIIPHPSGKALDPLLQNIGFHMWQYGNTGFMMLPKALSSHICEHFYAILADTPGGLTCNRRVRWRSIC